MNSLTDQIGNSLNLHAAPKRIICLVPSITEYLFDLGLGERVIGITKFCVHPQEWLKEKEIVGGTKQQHIEKIKNLEPDLIIASKEENVKAYIEKLAKICSVYVSDVSDLDSALEMMKDIGKLVVERDKADKLAVDIKEQFNDLEKPSETIDVAYCIWKKPWMWAGVDTFISNMLSSCGLKNVIQKERYPAIEMNEIVDSQPEFILLSSEPFPFQDQHIKELKAGFPKSTFIIVDGEMFSWYGSRMLKAPSYFNSLLNQLKSK
ncbi:ABC-type Fe3+-hydroxamate transport system, substrate-binding protein [Marivirga sericea]|uniref:ABC-type Fe3+-hydroxamate transport system, substrate-binding protein n=1 Tax=Marivirga sericea TaxID=1028 RepID=A0A1X7K2U3_9BACT|nr:helical backbone metal receptor [Marivirga sericea]SMG35255.1 ABC-type Fe3+-hydroxamate transport system, substrate-binding protein [Marivirga sericea]